MNKIRILIISHNAFSTTNNMGKTLSTLFYGFSKNEIAHLYFHSYDSDLDYCCTRFQITDFDVIKSIFLRKSCGRIVNALNIGNSPYEVNEIKNKIYKFGRDHSPLKLLVRDFIWKIGQWKTKTLFNWIESFSPTHIFFASGYSVFAYDIALLISKKYNIPLITYFCDDYFNENIKTHSPFYWIRKKIFRRKVNEVINKSTDLVFISDTMKKEYEKIFNKKGHVIMTPFSNFVVEEKEYKKPILLCYIGNVLLGRWEVLAKIAKAVNNINRYGNKIIFEIYSENATEKIIKELNYNGNIYFKGRLSSQEVKDKILESDILLHVESFKTTFIEKTKHSISTKIADCLASNRPLLVVGPKGIASVEYLRENNAAYIIDNENKIEEKLLEYFIEKDIDKTIVKNAKTLAMRNHDITRNSQKLRNIFENALKDD